MTEPGGRWTGRGALVGMVHAGALPGTPLALKPVAQLIDEAAAEAVALRAAGFDAVMVENMNDRPYLARGAGPEVVAVMTAVTRAVAGAFGGPCGVQVLAGANEAALAVALAAGASFVRCEGFVFAHVADEGWMDADAGPLLRYRARIGAQDIRVFCDIKKKHASHAVTADLSLAATARAAEFALADALVVTGEATGCPTREEDVREVVAATRLPVFVGSGVTPESARTMLELGAGVIVGSWIKHGGHWSGPVDAVRARRFVEAARG
jgi:hypothetical protein